MAADKEIGVIAEIEAGRDSSSANREEAATAIAITGTTVVADAINVDVADNAAAAAVVVDNSSSNRAVRAASRDSARHSLQ